MAAPGRQDRSYTLADVAAHTTRSDAWISYRGRVYDITPHIDNHPGWHHGGDTAVSAILAVLGTDATEAFDAIGAAHESAKVLAELRAYDIGALAGTA